MAQKWRERPTRQKTIAKPLDAAGLDSLALSYVGRFATSRGKLIAYLRRKLRERGWDGADEPPVEAAADRLVALRYVDDSAYAEMKSGAMQRQGLGPRRIAQKLTMDGIDETDRFAAAPDAIERWAAAERLAKRRRIGPFGEGTPDRALREKQIAAFLRAGHGMIEARLWVDAAPGAMPEQPFADD
jgi:regulatory protein